MAITCPACASRFALPPETIPKTAFRVTCGKCSHQFSVAPSAPVIGSGDGSPPLAEPPAPAALPGGREVAAAPVEAFQEGLRLAMVCDDRAEHAERICAALRGLGYKPHVAPRPREAIDWLFQHRYELLFVHEDFGGEPLAQNPVVVALSAMPMAQRRHICVGLCGRHVRTMDNVAAFHHSVHFVVNERDLPRLDGIVRSAVADNDSFYRVFREVLRHVGKS
ncbi:zinc-ribbon domain-containing protein [Gemmatimonas sp.]|jgi:predicted Zn finger-like uncharacterized protein|uniref:zinc-ribbon domain-containing protein n=1 Tax=Gemmatimonas sp. TaxID=1962908 RepID=UPI0037C06EAB